MDCGHYFMDDVGMQPASSNYERKCFRLGQCVVCLTTVCIDTYTDSGEIFDGRGLFFSPEIERIIREAFN